MCISVLACLSIILEAPDSIPTQQRSRAKERKKHCVCIFKMFTREAANIGVLIYKNRNNATFFALLIKREIS